MDLLVRYETRVPVQSIVDRLSDLNLPERIHPMHRSIQVDSADTP